MTLNKHKTTLGQFLPALILEVISLAHTKNRPIKTTAMSTDFTVEGGTALNAGRTVTIPTINSMAKEIQYKATAIPTLAGLSTS